MMWLVFAGGFIALVVLVLAVALREGYEAERRWVRRGDFDE